MMQEYSDFIKRLLEEYMLSEEEMTPSQKKIAEAALKLFAEKGFEGSTTSEIAKAAGVAEGTIYKYYKTKKELLFALVIPTIIRMIKKVLVVEDDQKILRFMRANLLASNYEVYTATDGEEALFKYEQLLPDIILLDIILPKLNGYQILQELRKFSQVPVILITAKRDVADIIKGLELGADDYIVKPFDVNELLARIKAVSRRTTAENAEQNPSINAGILNLNFRTLAVKVDGKDIKLTPTEFKLLAELAKNRGRVITHEDLLATVWGPEYRDETHYLRVCIAKIRQKTAVPKGTTGYIQTVPTVGYMMLAEVT